MDHQRTALTCRRLPSFLALAFLAIGLAPVRTLAQGQTIGLSAPPPSPVASVSAQSSASGTGFYCYWVVAIYPIGKALPTGPMCVGNAAGTVTVNWMPASQAIGYDVLRQSASVLPSGAVNSAVASNVACCSQTDSLGALNSYTVAGTSPAQANIRLDNLANPEPRVYLDTPLSLPTTGALIAPNITTALPPGTPGSFARFFDTTTKPMSAKKIVWLGNSTVQLATELFTQLATYTGKGQPLAGFTVTPVTLDAHGFIASVGNIVNMGVTGGTLAGFLADSTIFNICAVNPDLIIIRGTLINDVRTGATSLPQARAMMRQLLDRVTGCAPGADILLTVENSLLSADPTNLGQITPLASAQAYSTIIHDAVVSFAGAYPHVVVYDLQAALFGLSAPPSSPYMKDQLHPGPAGRIAEADLIAGLLAQMQFKPSVVSASAPACGSGTNKIVSGSDLGAAAWITIGSVTKDSSTQFTVSASGATAGLQLVSVTPGCLVFQFQAKAGTLKNPKYAVYDQTHAAYIIPATSYAADINSSTYSTISVPFTVPSGCTQVAVYFDANSTTTGTSFVQSVTVR